MSDADPVSVSESTTLAEMVVLLGELRALVVALQAEIAAKDVEIAELKQVIFGAKSERQKKTSSRQPPPVLTAEEKAKRRNAAKRNRAAARDKRKKELEERLVQHAAAQDCPSCSGSGPFRAMPPDISSELEYVTERLVRLQHVLEKKKCSCGTIFSAPAPTRVVDGGLYGPGLHAYAAVSKCADALPLYRISKRFSRAGVNIARSSLTDMFHRTASLLKPLQQRLLELVAESDYVNADETSQPVMDKDKCRRGFVWTFISAGIIAYVFTKGRGGATPELILKDSTGYLQVDGHTGYNTVCVPDKRERVGCIAHARRYFHKARDYSPDECRVAFEYFRKLYAVEIAAAEANILGTDAHGLLRRERSIPLMTAFKDWLDEQHGIHDPKGPLGKAVSYTRNQWPRLLKPFDDPKLRLDNNISEGALRIIALGRDNFRWVGHDEAGENLAILQTIVATCVANGVNPQTYITDVLIRIQTHPVSDIDAILPMNWAATVAAP